MKRLGFIVSLLLLAFAVQVSAQERLPADEINRIAQSVVEITVIVDGEFYPSGSGTIISADGLIYTNYHVIEGGEDFAIYMPTDLAELPELRYYASAVEVFPDFDFAILQIDRDERERDIDSGSLNLPFIQLAAALPVLGEPVFIFGYPSIGNGFLVFTNGTITTIQNEDFAGDRLPFLYQTDAEISPGNSGGTAVNLAGEFIGIPSVVQSEERTGGRLGGIISLAALQFALDTGGSGFEPGDDPRDDGNDSPAPSSGELDYRLDSNYGETQLERRFDDPHVIEAISGPTQESNVDIASLNLGDQCRGFATSQPDYRVFWSGDANFLRIFFAAEGGEGDTVLVINQPDGSWICVDDSFNTLSPTIDFTPPLEGQYDIWIASYYADENVPGSLVITEDDNLTPDNFQ